MKGLRFAIDIRAPRETVWSTLWEDGTLRDWASIIDEGMYMAGELQEGNEVQFLSSVGGYGVTSRVEKLVPNEFVLFRQLQDTKEGGTQEREKEWAGGTESYTLTERDGVTTLTLATDVPPEQEATMEARLPKALERIRALSEAST